MLSLLRRERIRVGGRKYCQPCVVPGKIVNGRKCKRSMWLSESGGKNQKSVRGTIRLEVRLGEWMLLGRRCWQLT